jgi:hypothetical protein
MMTRIEKLDTYAMAEFVSYGIRFTLLPNGAED